MTTTTCALIELAPMQRELDVLRQAWEADAEALRAVVAFRARALSDRALALSGVLEP
jgi:hypothetical protein